MSIKPEMAQELYKAFKRLDAPVELLSIIGSLADTLSDDECLSLLKDYNATGEYIHTVQ